MEIMQLSGLSKKNLNLIARGQISNIYQLPDGRIFKYFNVQMLQFWKSVNFDIEAKVLDASNVKTPAAIIKPEVAVYDKNNFVGYIMQKARGVDYNVYDQSLSLGDRSNLYKYAMIHSKLEEIVKSTPDIVYPDLCTCDNIYICDNEIQLIDYDGFQVGNHSSLCISTSLGSLEQHLNSSKYFTVNHLFTKELDKKSLIILYFLDAFNVNLNQLGAVEPMSGRVVTLDDIFEIIGLEDYDVMNKVWKIFYGKKENEYLGEDVFRIAEDYQLVVAPLQVQKGGYLKKLVKK